MNSKWERVADSLRAQLDQGTLKPGAWPSIGRISQQLGLSRKTVAKAFRVLETKGWLKRHRGCGYVVQERSALPVRDLDT